MRNDTFFGVAINTHEHWHTSEHNGVEGANMLNVCLIVEAAVWAVIIVAVLFYVVSARAHAKSPRAQIVGVQAKIASAYAKWL